MFPQVSKIDLYVGGDLLSPVDDKRLIGKCHFPERVVRLSLFCFFKLIVFSVEFLRNLRIYAIYKLTLCIQLSAD